jgi:hypothetical protein
LDELLEFVHVPPAEVTMVWACGINDLGGIDDTDLNLVAHADVRAKPLNDAFG